MTKMTSPTWIYDGSPIADPLGYGERAVEFLRALKHPKNRGARAARSAWPVAGADRAAHLRPAPRGRRAHGPHASYILLPRGDRKTTLGAALGLLHTFGPERVPGGRAVIAAGAQEQAIARLRRGREASCSTKAAVEAAQRP